MVSDEQANPIEQALSALMAYHGRHATEAQDVVELPTEEIEGRLNLFSKVKLDDSVKSLVGASQFAAFSLPLLIRNLTREKVEVIERMLGRSSSQVGSMATEIIKDLTYVTDYPPPIEGILLPSEEVVAIGNELCDYVSSLKEQEF